MRALNIFRLLSLAVALNHGEATDAVNEEGKQINEEGRKLQYDWRYWDQYNYLAFTGEPTPRPTFKPTHYPSPRPTPSPTGRPTYSPTHYPSPRPTPRPTAKPSPRPTRAPTGHPVPKPTRRPTPNPTERPTPQPTIRPTPSPTKMPTMRPSASPSDRPTPGPTAFPTPRPSFRPTPLPTTKPPTNNPTSLQEPSEEPTEEPSEEPTESLEPSENPTSTTSFSGSETLSFTDGCLGRETILDIICAPFNSNVLGDLCNEVRERGLDDLLNDCNRRLTLFAPSNFAWSRFFNYFTDDFFNDPNNFPLVSIVDDDAPLVNNRRKLDEDFDPEDFKQEVLASILGYNIAFNPLTLQQLDCPDDEGAQPLYMLSRGSTTTVCDGEARTAQMGTCNAQRSVFLQGNIVAANGIIHMTNEVMIPSPDGTLAGCDDIGPAGGTGRAFLIRSDP